MKVKHLALFLVLLAGNCVAQKNASIVKFSNPSPAGYSQSVEIDLGKVKLLTISGQVPLDNQGNLVGKGNLALQLEQTFQNIKTMVENAGGTMQDVVKLSYFLKDISQIQLVREVRNRFINVQNPPASTAVEVSGLFRDDILVEIEATAVVPRKK
jgi:2-iminobutanoate/2-iminopropanoate deaminase